jgi:hypothetical protein
MVVLFSAQNLVLFWQAKALRGLNDQTGKFLTSQGIRIVDSLDRISYRLDHPSGDCPWCGERFMWSESAKDYLKVYDLTFYHMKATLDQVTTSLIQIQDSIKENKGNK